MREVLDDLQRWQRRGDRVAVATVVSANSSAPRMIGSKLLVTEPGEIAGSVSGGCVEGAVIEVAERVLAGAPPQLLSFGAVLDPLGGDVGLPCGGEIEVLVETALPAEWVSAISPDTRVVVITTLEGPRTGARLMIGSDGSTRGSLGDPDADRDAIGAAAGLTRSERRAGLFYDVLSPRSRLVLFGAGDISVALCRLASASGWRVDVIDPRARFATAERFPEAASVIAEWPDSGFARAGGLDAETSVVVLTHDAKLDDAALEIALRSPVRFIGAMGSRRAHARRCERLAEAGLGEQALARIAAPLGLDLGASNREETALSIFAEIVAARHGRAGGRLQDLAGPIHDGAVREMAPR